MSTWRPEEGLNPGDDATVRPIEAELIEQATGRPVETPSQATPEQLDEASADASSVAEVEASDLADAAEESADEQREWWNDPSMPWKHKPGRADIACMAWIGFLGLFSMAMMPLRAWLLGAPERLPWLVTLMGSRSGTTALGSLVRVGTELPFVWPILIGTLMSIKLDWVYWWAGKLWGRGMIEVWAGQSARTARNYARVERWANKLGWVGMFVAYVPIPLPIMAVVFVLAGAHGWSVKRFLLLDAAASFTWLIIYFFFGYLVGEPAVAVLEVYAKIANYVAIGLVVAIVVMTFVRSSRQIKQAS